MYQNTVKTEEITANSSNILTQILDELDRMDMNAGFIATGVPIIGAEGTVTQNARKLASLISTTSYEDLRNAVLVEDDGSKELIRLEALGLTRCGAIVAVWRMGGHYYVGTPYIKKIGGEVGGKMCRLMIDSHTVGHTDRKSTIDRVINGWNAISIQSGRIAIFTKL